MSSSSRGLAVFEILFIFLKKIGASPQSSGCPETHNVDQAGLKFRDPFNSAS